MALQARHRFLIKHVEDALLPGNEQMVEDLIRHEPILNRINSLFDPNGLQALVFTYYPSDSSDIPPLPTNNAESNEDEKKEGGQQQPGNGGGHAGFQDLRGKPGRIQGTPG